MMWIILAVIILILVWLWATYNRLISLKTRTDESWSDIDTQLKRRYDLIPNLVETVKGYATHEKGVFEQVTAARAKAMEVTVKGNPAEIAQSENTLASALKSVFAVAENYPDLKASQNFLSLQGELSDTENKIEAARRFYNGNVREFNIAIKLFPNTLIAGGLGFSEKKFFELEAPQEREAPKVSF